MKCTGDFVEDSFFDFFSFFLAMEFSRLELPTRAVVCILYRRGSSQSPERNASAARCGAFLPGRFGLPGLLPLFYPPP